MKTSQKLIALPLVAAALAAALTGCSSNGASHTAIEPTQAAAPAVATSSAPAAVATTAPAATAPVAVPTAGSTVAAAQVAAVRAAGGHVYVSPNGGGAGLVVEPAAPLPQVIIDDLHTGITAAPAPYGTGAAFAAWQAPRAAEGKAISQSGIKVFTMWVQPDAFNAPSGKVHNRYIVDGGNLGHTDDYATPAEAVAAAKPLLAANPGVPLVTFDGLVANR